MRKNDNGKFIYLFVGVVGVLVIVFQLKTKLYAEELNPSVVTSSMAENMSDDEIISALVSDNENVPDAEIIEGDFIDADGVYYANNDSVVFSYDDSALIELLTDIYDSIGYLGDQFDSIDEQFNFLLRGDGGYTFPYPLLNYNYIVQFDTPNNTSFLLTTSDFQSSLISEDMLTISGEFYAYSVISDGVYRPLDLSPFYDSNSDHPNVTYVRFPFPISDVSFADKSSLNKPPVYGLFSVFPYIIIIAQCLIVFVCLFAFVEIYRTSKMIRKKFLGGEN